MSKARVLRFADQLRIEGINYLGFGIIPKYVMLDRDLTIEAKAIYAYFCSFAGNGTTTFPGREKILSDLQVSKDGYYKHFNLLLEQGYLIVEQKTTEGARFAKNIYTLVSNPKKFQDKPNDTSQARVYSRIRFSGLKSAGYGLIPKAAMIDARLSIKAKAIYAYFCAFSGSGEAAFPKRDEILYHLKVSEPTYYKHYQALTELNYIKAVQRHVSGRLSVNDYYLIDNPDETKAPHYQDKKNQDTEKQSLKNQDTENQHLKNQDTERPNDLYPKKQDTEKQDSKKQDTEKQDTNKNNLNINSSNKNNSFNSQPATPERSGKSDAIPDEMLCFTIWDELIRNQKLPYSYSTDRRKMEIAIHYMSGWDDLYLADDENDQKIYALFNRALIDLCCSRATRIKGATVRAPMVIAMINQLAQFEDSAVSISVFSEPAMDHFRKAYEDRPIKHPLAYMKSCIWDAMQNCSVVCQSL